MTSHALSDTLRELRAQLAPTGQEYEHHLKAKGIIAASESLATRPDLALAVYRDWQRRKQVACVFARLIALYPAAYDVAWEVIEEHVDAGNVETMAIEVAKRVEPMRGQEEGVAILLPGLVLPEALSLLCKALGRQPGWYVRAPFNPSDRLDRVYVRVTTELAPNVEAEILGVAPFDFIPATRRAPVIALHIRTKTERAKRRGHNDPDKAHLADMEWPEGRSRRFEQYWEATVEQRSTVLGGDDSAARARVTFAIPKDVWDSIEGKN